MVKLLFLLLSVLSMPVNADIYPAAKTYKYYLSDTLGYHESPTGQGLCDMLKDDRTWTFSASPSSHCDVFNPDGSSSGYTLVNGPLTTYTCPAGGTLSGRDCINAPDCPVDQFRNANTGICQKPQNCTYPQAYDSSTNTCVTLPCDPGYQRGGESDGYECMLMPTCPSVMPLCASTAYDCNNGDGTQQHVNQCSTACPTGQHMEGNSCIDDKTTPITCPAGMVAKNGGCEAAPPIVCPAGTRPGTVNGESVCASSSSVDPTKPRDQHNTAESNGTETTTTQHKDSNGQVTGTSTSTTTTTSKIDLNTTGLASESTQKGILNALTETSKAPGTLPDADSTALDTAVTAAESATDLSNPGSYFFSNFVVLPSAQCQSIAMNYKSLNYTFDPCTKLQSFRDLLGYFFYIITVIFIYQTATKPAGD